MRNIPSKKITDSLKNADEWLDIARIAFDETNLDRCVASALIALTHTNVAIVQYIMERDAEPYSHDKHLLDLGMEIGEQLSRRTPDSDKT